VLGVEVFQAQTHDIEASIWPWIIFSFSAQISLDMPGGSFSYQLCKEGILDIAVVFGLKQNYQGIFYISSLQSLDHLRHQVTVRVGYLVYIYCRASLHRM